MLKPKCPSCFGELTFLHGFKMPNPWRCKCPLCGAVLEAGKISKVSMLLALPIGLLIAGVAIFQEETGNWEETDSYIFFAIIFSIVIFVAMRLWSKSDFRLKQ